MDEFLEYEVFLKEKEGGDNIFDQKFEHNITSKQLERLQNIEIQSGTDILFSYVLVKNFYISTEPDDTTYKAWQDIFAKVFKGCREHEEDNILLEIVDDVCSLEVCSSKSYMFGGSKGRQN